MAKTKTREVRQEIKAIEAEQGGSKIPAEREYHYRRFGFSVQDKRQCENCIQNPFFVLYELEHDMQFRTRQFKKRMSEYVYPDNIAQSMYDDAQIEIAAKLLPKLLSHIALVYVKESPLVKKIKDMKNRIGMSASLLSFNDELSKQLVEHSERWIVDIIIKALELQKSHMWSEYIVLQVNYTQLLESSMQPPTGQSPKQIQEVIALKNANLELLPSFRTRIQTLEAEIFAGDKLLIKRKDVIPKDKLPFPERFALDYTGLFGIGNEKTWALEQEENDEVEDEY